MAEEDQEFFQRLLAAYQVEAGEHLQAMSAGLTELEAEPALIRKKEIVGIIYREVHSLKGASRAVEMRPVERVCQALEDIFDDWKKREAAPQPEALRILHRAVDLIPGFLRSPGAAADASSRETVRQLHALRAAEPGPAGVSREGGTAGRNDTSEPGTSLRPSAGQPADAGLPSPRFPEFSAAGESAEPRPGVETVRISTAKLDSVLVQAEEMLAAKLTAARCAEELRGLKSDLLRMRTEWGGVEPELRALLKRQTAESESGALAAFIEGNSARLKSFEARVHSLVRTADRDQRQLSGMVDSLLVDAKRLVLLPVGTLLEGFPRMVRELARDEGKEVQFILRGHDVEIDKRILEEIKDPLTHVLRNCVDHGVEVPAERGAKPRRATIELSISQTGGNEVRITVTDDGRGIDVIKVKNAAVKKGKLTAEEARRLTEDEARRLIFRSDVSTTAAITRISGRGLGLTIAREKVQKLGGHISVESEAGCGTVFRIHLPVTLATLRAVFVSVNGRQFAVPVTEVDRVIAVQAHEVRPMEGRETISLDRRVVPLVRLDDALELPSPSGGNEPGRKRFPCLVLGAVEQRIAFRVDEIGAAQEILVKPLAFPLLRVRNVAGATILADGRPAPILHVPDLLKSAAKMSPVAPNPAASLESKPEAEKVRVLIAEDSITSRMLLKNILETVGYPVATAADGAEALATLRTGDFGLVISDVDMPRMDGFDLTAAIRRDPRLTSLPVILITARETAEDREHGIDAGANAYIVKSSFDQSDLLEVIRRLV